MKESCQELEINTIELTKFRSNTNELNVILIKISKTQIQRIMGNSYKSNYFKKKNVRNKVYNQQEIKYS